MSAAMTFTEHEEEIWMLYKPNLLVSLLDTVPLV